MEKWYCGDCGGCVSAIQRVVGDIKFWSGKRFITSRFKIVLWVTENSPFFCLDINFFPKKIQSFLGPGGSWDVSEYWDICGRMWLAGEKLGDGPGRRCDTEGAGWAGPTVRRRERGGAPPPPVQQFLVSAVRPWKPPKTGRSATNLFQATNNDFSVFSV